MSKQRKQYREAKRVVLEVINRTDCGDCKVCCTLMGVNELQKPYWQPCEHLTGKGCGIYNDRPASCAAYYCGYRAGFPIKRPNESGVLFDVQQARTMGFVFAYETVPGTAKDPKNVFAFGTMQQLAPVVVIPRQPQSDTCLGYLWREPEKWVSFKSIGDGNSLVSVTKERLENFPVA